MKIHLYIDEDSMSRALVRGLRSRDIDVTTALEAGMIAQPDIKQLRRLLKLIATKSAEDFRNQVEFLGHW